MAFRLSVFFFLLAFLTASFYGGPLHAASFGKGICEHQTYQFSNMTPNYPASSAELTAIVNNPYITCLQLSYYWAQLEPTQGNYQWSIIDGEMAPFANAGKKIWIEIKTAPYVPSTQGSAGYPQWIIGKGVPVIGSPSDGLGVDPVFWNPTYQSLWETFITAFAARYDGNANIEFISIGGYSAGTEPGLATNEQNDAHCAEWMAAGLDPGIDTCLPGTTSHRVKNSNFYTSAEAAALGVQPVYLNTVMWMEDMYKRHFHTTPLMRAIHVTNAWDLEANGRTAGKGIGWGSNGLNGTNDPTGRQSSSDAQTQYHIPVGFFEFGPKAFQDNGTQITTLEQYKRAIGDTSTYSPWSRRSYLPIGAIQSNETQAEWQAALQWAYDNEYNWLGNPSPPPAPSNLTASPISSSQINLQWTDNSTNEDSFKVERCQGSGCSSFTEIASVGANVTTYQNTGLSASTSYSYRVRAHNSTGYSGYSATAAAVTSAPSDGSAPSTPSGLIATANSYSQITLSWLASTDTGGSGLSGYRVFRSGSSGGPFTQIATTTGTTYVNSGLSAQTTYYYYVNAYDGAGNTSPNSLTANATTPSQALCGNGVVDSGEQCDGSNLNGQSCTTLGFLSGTLSCSGCAFVTSGCVASQSTPTLTASLSALPIVGVPPLTVSLTAVAGGTASGNINYTFYCNRSDTGTNITSPYDAKYDGQTISTFSVSNLCVYQGAGIYTAKVVIERGSVPPAEARATITVSPLITTDTTPPSVSIASPSQGAVVSGSSVLVSVSAWDNIAVAGVQFKLDGSNLGGEDLTSPYQVVWDTVSAANGTHTLSATARDGSGNSTTATSVAVTVSNVISSAQSSPTSPAPTSAPTVTLTKNLFYGVKDSEVPLLQDFLRKLGFFSYPENTTFFGSLTQSAVIAYQKANGITPAAGYVGSLTRTKMAGGQAVPSAPAVSAPPVFSSSGTRTLSEGLSGNDVLLLQQRLQFLGFFPKTTTPNGSFGPVTTYAVQTFQCLRLTPPVCYGTPDTTGYGAVGPKTRSALGL